MQIYRIYIPGNLSIGLTITFDNDDMNYLTNVIRSKNGHIIRIFNSEYGEFEGILKLEKKSASLDIAKLIRSPEKNTHKLKLFFCPIKHHNMHIMIEKAVELGVTDLYPIISTNTIIREFNAEKYTKISIQAVEQCERLDIPKIHDMMTFYHMVDYISSSKDRILFAYEKSSSDISNEQFDGIIIGPEGGFKDEEVSLLKSIKNISEISLGKNILRAETAAIAGLSIINFKRRNGN